MSQIKGKDTKPEMMVRRFLHHAGLRFRLHIKELAGKPDIILPKYKIVIFIHGCFWHGHVGCKYFKLPKTRTSWWSDKIAKNNERDVRNRFLLEAGGWKVIEIYECSLKPNSREQTLVALLGAILSNQNG